MWLLMWSYCRNVYLRMSADDMRDLVALHFHFWWWISLCCGQLDWEKYSSSARTGSETSVVVMVSSLGCGSACYNTMPHSCCYLCQRCLWMMFGISRTPSGFPSDIYSMLYDRQGHLRMVALCADLMWAAVVIVLVFAVVSFTVGSLSVHLQWM